jgi:hypothetical protein
MSGKLLLAFSSAVILGSKSHGTYDHFYCLVTLGAVQLKLLTHCRATSIFGPSYSLGVECKKNSTDLIENTTP